MIEINGEKIRIEDFLAWLESRPEEFLGSANDPLDCLIGMFFQDKGFKDIFMGYTQITLNGVIVVNSGDLIITADNDFCYVARWLDDYAIKRDGLLNGYLVYSVKEAVRQVRSYIQLKNR